MSTTVKAGWLKDSQGNKFAPKTLSSQVITNDGLILEEKIVADLNTLETSVKGYTDTKVADLVGAAPELLDTFEEVATAIKENQDVADALQSAIGNKVDKEEGKGLSSNDFTDEEKEKLASLSENGSLTDEEKALLASIENKVDIAQGAENAGKILSVDEEGNVSLNTAPEMMAIAYDEEEQILEFTSKSQLPGNVGVDTSLSTSGDAADAKVVGDRLKALEEMLENGVGIVEETQADWNQNDPEALDYVKNRPCYFKEPIENTLLTDFGFTGNQGTAYLDLDSLTIGRTYKVVFDGVTYDNLVCEEANGLPSIGATSQANSNYPFIVGVSNGQAMIRAMQNTSHTITVIEYLDNVQALDERFIPYVAGRKVEGTNYPFYDEYTDSTSYNLAEVGTEIFNDYANNMAIWQYAHAEGNQTVAHGRQSHAEGLETKAIGDNSHSEGAMTTARGAASHAEGEVTHAIGDASHVEGYFTTARGFVQHVQGAFNIEDTDERYLHIVGNGSYNEDDQGATFSNAHTVDWQGNAWFAGDVYIGGTGQTDAVAKKLATKEEVDELKAMLETYIARVAALVGGDA